MITIVEPSDSDFAVSFSFAGVSEVDSTDCVTVADSCTGTVFRGEGS
jgi:hypothetical protein